MSLFMLRFVSVPTTTITATKKTPKTTTTKHTPKTTTAKPTTKTTTTKPTPKTATTKPTSTAMTTRTITVPTVPTKGKYVYDNCGHFKVKKIVVLS